MSNDSPFFNSRIECPVCKTVNEYESIKVGAYVESERDTDFCPTGIKWRYEKYESYNPLVFFIATCSTCCYSREFTSSFKDWQSASHFKTYRLKTVRAGHLAQLGDGDSVIKKFASGLDVSRYPNESAIIKLHLAILDEELSERPNFLDLGRWYLRLGWVFRDLGKGENPNKGFLKGLLAEIKSQYNQLLASVNNTKEISSVFKRHLNAHFETDKISAEMKLLMMPFKDQFIAKLEEFEKSAELNQQQLNSLENLLEEYQTMTVGAYDGDNAGSFGGFPAFTDFLSDISENWDGCVINERQSLTKAAHYYKQAFIDGHHISQGNQQVQALYLIAELSRRTGQHDQAKEYFASTIKHGQELIYRHREDKSQTALARKILELAIEQNKILKEEAKS